MSFLYDKNFYLPLINEYILKEAQATGTINQNDLNKLAIKLIKNLDEQFKVTSEGGIPLGIIQLSNLENFIKYVDSQKIRINNIPILLSATDFNSLSDKSLKSQYIIFNDQYFINKKLFTQYMERLKLKASKLRDNEETAQSGQNFQSLISRLITEINSISPNMKLNTQITQQQPSEDTSEKQPILRTSVIDSISKSFDLENETIEDGEVKLKYYNIESSSNFNTWLRAKNITVYIKANNITNNISLLSEDGKQYLPAFFSALLNRAEISENKNIKQIYIDQIIKIAKENNIELSSALQTKPQKSIKQQDGYAQQVSYTAGGDLSQIQPGSAKFHEIEEYVTRIMQQSPLQPSSIILSNIQTFASYLYHLDDSELLRYSSDITNQVNAVKRIYDEDILDLNADWIKYPDGSFRPASQGLSNLMGKQQLLTYFMQMTSVIDSVRKAIIAFHNRYKRFFKTQAEITYRQQIGSDTSTAGSAYADNFRLLQQYIQRSRGYN